MFCWIAYRFRFREICGLKEKWLIDMLYPDFPQEIADIVDEGWMPPHAPILRSRTKSIGGMRTGYNLLVDEYVDANQAEAIRTPRDV